PRQQLIAEHQAEGQVDRRERELPPRPPRVAVEPFQHAVKLPEGPLVHGVASRAARRVFRRSMATVIGPTPPGTGVMSEATWAAPAKCTSPQSEPSSRRFMPTSTTTAPGLIHSARTCSG